MSGGITSGAVELEFWYFRFEWRPDVCASSRLQRPSRAMVRATSREPLPHCVLVLRERGGGIAGGPQEWDVKDYSF